LSGTLYVAETSRSIANDAFWKNRSAVTSDEPVCALATYVGSYFVGFTFTSHTLNAAQRLNSSAFRI
jgi:hypothetical protein